MNFKIENLGFSKLDKQKTFHGLIHNSPILYIDHKNLTEPLDYYFNAILPFSEMAGEPTYAMYQWGAPSGSGFGNITVVDKVPPEMLHMIDPHW